LANATVNTIPGPAIRRATRHTCRRGGTFRRSPTGEQSDTSTANSVATTSGVACSPSVAASGAPMTAPAIQPNSS
jgi:hypothetical protein